MNIYVFNLRNSSVLDMCGYNRCVFFEEINVKIFVDKNRKLKKFLKIIFIFYYDNLFKVF